MREIVVLVEFKDGTKKLLKFSAWDDMLKWIETAEYRRVRIEFR